MFVSAEQQNESAICWTLNFFKCKSDTVFLHSAYQCPPVTLVIIFEVLLTMSGPYDLLWPDRLSHPLCSLASVTTCTSFIRSLPVIVAFLSFLKGSHESCLRTYQLGVLPWGFCLVSLLCPNKLSLVFQWLTSLQFHLKKPFVERSLFFSPCFS